ncbi:MAG: lyase family protein [Nanoarchaeota archaeon]|nr:lyase family protein [Nanoarchaeota archaeon]
MVEKDRDLVSKLDPQTRIVLQFALNCVSPDDGKYGGDFAPLKPYLSERAEWLACANLQALLLETRMEFGQAEQKHVDEMREALKKINPLNIALLEKDRSINHDQLAVLEEIGRHVSPETKALLHPGTTSYDILDTVRSHLYISAWADVIRPEVTKSIMQMCDIADKSLEVLQIGRTHLQNTSPVPFGATIAGYAARLVERTEKCDSNFFSLKGKISGIVGTGASIEAVIGEGLGLEFERRVLKKLDLKPDKTATQIVQKEGLVDVGNGLVTLSGVLGNFANDMRMLYSSAIGEVTSRDNKESLGGSSADATKNNPIMWENIAGKVVVIESGMRVLYEMMRTDFQRDLRGSVQARYQPRAMMAETFEAFSRLNKALPQLSLNYDRIEQNLRSYRYNPSEAMVAILRGEGWSHSQYGVGHDFVKHVGKLAQTSRKKLLDVAKEDGEFSALFDSLPDNKRRILNGEVELYTGHSIERARDNIVNSRAFAST